MFLWHLVLSDRFVVLLDRVLNWVITVMRYPVHVHADPELRRRNTSGLQKPLPFSRVWWSLRMMTHTDKSIDQLELLRIGVFTIVPADSVLRWSQYRMILTIAFLSLSSHRKSSFVRGISSAKGHLISSSCLILEL